MKKFIIGLMVLVMCSGITMPIENTESEQPKTNLNSFMGLEFGSELKLTKAEMFSTYPELKNSLPKLSKKVEFNKKRTLAEYAAKNSNFGGISAHIYLHFTESIDGRFVFTAVIINFDSEGFRNCKSMLINKYGQPTTIQTTENVDSGFKSPMSQSLRWDLDDIKLKIIADEYNNKASDVVSLLIRKKTGEPNFWRSRGLIKVISSTDSPF